MCWRSQVNKGGGCNASVFDYRIGDCVVLTPTHFNAMMVRHRHHFLAQISGAGC